MINRTHVGSTLQKWIAVTALACTITAVSLAGTTRAAESEAVAAAPASTPAKLDTGDNAWMLVSSALVLMMTGPGLALFYSGLVRKKNVLSVMMQCVFLMCLMTVIWGLWGYTLGFGGDCARPAAKTAGELRPSDDEGRAGHVGRRQIGDSRRIPD